MKVRSDSREAGKITQAESERKHQGLILELPGMAQKEREKIKTWAVKSDKVRDEAEYKRLCAHYHDAYGNSFHHFLASIHARASFLTMNEKTLDDARLLELRFGGKILSSEQVVAEQERESVEKEHAVQGTGETKHPTNVSPWRALGAFCGIQANKRNTGVQNPSK